MRRYYLPSSTHGGGNGQTTENPAAAGAVNCPGNNWGNGTLRANPVPATGLVNRMRVALRDWVLNGHAAAAEPAGRRCTGPKDERNLVEPTKTGDGIPERRSRHPGLDLQAGELRLPGVRLRLGSGYDHSEATGNPTNAPPPIRHVIKMLVPRVDKDGNELGGVPTVQSDAPLGTYLGWNITAGPGDVGYDNTAVPRRPGLQLRRRHGAVLQDQGAAPRGRRPAPLAGGALRHARRLCRCRNERRPTMRTRRDICSRRIATR